MSSRNPRPTVAMVEDADEDDRVIAGSGHYARSNALSPPGSPLRQQMNTSKKKSSRRRDPSMSPPGYDDGSDLPSPPSKPSRRDSKTEKKRSSMGGSKGKTVVLKEDPRPRRPSTRTAKTAPAPPSRGLADEASYYGIPSQTIIPSHSRPRAATARPASYYGTTRPPLSHSAYYGGSTPMGTSFPPPPWNGGPGMPPMGPPQMMAQSPLSGPPVDYFSNNARPADTLAARFSRQGEPRPRSSLDFHGPPSAYEDYEQVIEAPPPQRQASLARRPKKDQDDRARMPPPSRPQTTKPERLVFRPPPPRKSAHFEDEELDDEGEGEDDLYQPAPGRQPSFEYGTAVVPSRPRRTSFDSDYDDGVFALEPAGHNRRHSSYNFEDKMKQATSYQNDVAGGPTAPLTAETLRRVKNGGTSRSSRSTQSRDESSYKQSATTRTTRSSSGDDDITIKVPDGAIVEVGNAKISCRMGGEINIGRNNGGSDRGTVYDDDRKSRAIEDRKSRAIEDRKSRAIEDRKSRAIEDRKSRTYDDDRKSRTDKPATRNRASSQSGSFSHAPYHGGYGGYAPPFGSHYGSPGHYAPQYQYPPSQYPSSEYEY
ncbi:hypothetical protein PG994_009155 [Apiospora phragmitis]|uniref:Uncharacterized protein n=1 Tax=Apiospora phragmitis TaxID=2905665 RepID=A0ABR1UIH2_9PEZI